MTQGGSGLSYRLRTLLRFIYGTDNRVAAWLTVLGGAACTLRILVTVALLFAGDVPPRCTGGRFAPPCTQNVFTQIVLPVIRDFIVYPGCWWLVIGIVGLLVRRYRVPERPKDFTKRGAPKHGLWVVITSVYGTDYKVAVWFLIMGGVWVARAAIDVAPSFLAWGVPPGYAWIGVNPRPVENLFSDALVPMASYIMQLPGSWLIIAGAFGGGVIRLNSMWQHR